LKKLGLPKTSCVAILNEFWEKPATDIKMPRSNDGMNGVIFYSIDQKLGEIAA
jgi:hypothetical protein